MTVRREFNKAVRLAAWERASGACEKCGAKLYPGKFQYDHDKMDTFGGEATLQNCRVLCSNCHTGKTSGEAKLVSKSNRVRNKHLGIKPRKKRGFSFYRKFNGTIVRRER